MNKNFQEKSIQTGTGEIFYHLDNGFSGKPTVVLLHGLSSNHTTWINVMNFLHKNGYNSIAIDMRGHGLSDKTKTKNLYKLSMFSGDLDAIIKREKIDNFVLVGYSFGGQVALDYAARFPEFLKGLILISVNHKNPLEYKGLKFLGLKFLTPVVSGCINLLAFLMLWQKMEKYHYYQHGKAVGYWDSVWDGLRTMPISVNFWLLAEEFKINLESAARKIKIPTIIVYGKNDAFITERETREMADEISNSKIVISTNPDHFIGTNSQDETIKIILDFLKEIT